MSSIEKYLRQKAKKQKEKKIGVGGRIFGALFGFIFLCPGLLFMGWAFLDVAHGIKMQCWPAVPGQILAVNLKSNSDSDGGTTYRTQATYSYSYNGQTYQGSRASLYDGESDNIGDFQENLAARLESQKRAGGATEVYINPDDPSDSILMRDIRWGFFTFKFLFGLVFAVVGGLVLYASISRQKAKQHASNPEYLMHPWLMNKKWQTSEILSDAKGAVWGSFFFALIWNAITVPSTIIALPEIQREENYLALLILLFPLVGLYLIYMAVKTWLEYRRYGKTPLVMDPFPGSIGGQVGGTIDMRSRLVVDAKYKIHLVNVHSYISGSGKNRSRKERVLWEKTVIAHAEPYLEGTRLTFAIDVPDDACRPSDAEKSSSSYDLWRLNLNSDVPGVDLDRNFEIPVYLTGEKSRNISHRVSEDMLSQDREYNQNLVIEHLPLAQGTQGYELYFPYFRSIGAGLSGIVFAAVFLAVAWFTYSSDDVPLFFCTAFGFFGAVILLCSLYAMLNSLYVFSDGIYIYAHRKILGVSASRKMIEISQLKALEIKSSSTQTTGKKTMSYYKIIAKDMTGKKLVFAEGLPGRNVAEHALESIKTAFGLKIS